MKLIVEIDDEIYKTWRREGKYASHSYAQKIILNGTPSTETSKGRWVKEESILGWDGRSYQCSNCGRSIHLDTAMEDLSDYPYCHCGAEMSGGKEDGDSN